MNEVDAKNSPFRLPTDLEIDAAENSLGMKFHPDYRKFLLNGGDVANAVFTPAVVLPGSGYCDLVEIAETAWKVMGVPRHYLPFIEDNGDYFCITSDGDIVYWSHDGATSERWSTLELWYQQVCVERK